MQDFCLTTPVTKFHFDWNLLVFIFVHNLNLITDFSNYLYQLLKMIFLILITVCDIIFRVMMSQVKIFALASFELEIWKTP